MPSDTAVSVSVPRWALEFVMDRGTFQDKGPWGEGWASPEMRRAKDAIESALAGKDTTDAAGSDAARAFGRNEAIEEGTGSANVLMAELGRLRASNTEIIQLAAQYQDEIVRLRASELRRIEETDRVLAANASLRAAISWAKDVACLSAVRK
jgi:hypothetical protein